MKLALVITTITLLLFIYFKVDTYETLKLRSLHVVDIGEQTTEADNLDLVGLSVVDKKNHRIKGLEDELANLKIRHTDLQHRIMSVNDSLICYAPPGPITKNEQSVFKIDAKVVSVDPKFEVVVLNVGSKQCVHVGYRFHINRSGEYICDVIVKEVRDDYAACYIDKPTKINDHLGLFKGVERFDDASTK